MVWRCNAGAGDAPDESLYLFQPKLFYYSPKYTINVIGDVNNMGEVVLTEEILEILVEVLEAKVHLMVQTLSLGDAGIGFLTASARNANRIVTKLSALNFSYSPNKN